LRIVTAVAFALVTVNLEYPAGAFGAFVIAAAMAAGSGIATRDLLLRLAALEGFMIMLLLTLPFTVPGEPFFELGPLIGSREGLLSALLIMLKANAVMLALLALVGSLEPVVFGHALARLGTPEKLVHLLLLTVRQIHLLYQEFLRLRQAMRARAFMPRSDRHTWRSYGYLMGMLLVRSLARSQRILAAMRCRGFHGQLHLLHSTAWRPADTAMAAGLTMLLICLPALDRLL
jgi:cobalt/nickel transport system permease protein